MVQENGTKASILLVEGDRASREEWARALSGKGYGVVPVEDEAQGLLRLKSDRFDLVVAEVARGQGDRLALLHAVKERAPELPVVLLASVGSADLAAEAMREGAEAVLVRPCEPAALVCAVTSALAGRNGGSLAAAADTGGRRPATARGKPLTLLTQDARLRHVLEMAERVASSTATVLIQGESGTGKELLARFIHRRSPRRAKPFVAVNCAALPDGLLESELFGHEKGAFTGAIARKSGKFELAHEGTLLLDEVSELALHLQAKLLRVLQEGEVDRVGGATPVAVDVRVIATTNRRMGESVRKKQFRDDLYYRLNVIPLVIPPLRERPRDIRILADHFLRQACDANRLPPCPLSDQAWEWMLSHSWPGNVRELQNIVERGVLLSRGAPIGKEHLLVEHQLDGEGFPGVAAGRTVHEVERHLIQKTLVEVGGNRTHAAQLLGISVRTLRNKLNEYKQVAAKEGS